VLKNMLMRLKQFQCFISVLFHDVRRALEDQSKITRASQRHRHSDTVLIIMLF